MTVIFLFSAQDADSSDAQSGFVVDLLGTVTKSEGDIETFLVRKAAHIFAYFVLGLLLYNALRTHALSGRKIALASITIACVYALTDELHQVYVPGRSGEIRDVLIDTAAAALAVGLCSLCVYLSRRWSEKRYNK